MSKNAKKTKEQEQDKKDVVNKEADTKIDVKTNNKKTTKNKSTGAKSSKKVRDLLGIENASWNYVEVEKNKKISGVEPLFERI